MSFGSISTVVLGVLIAISPRVRAQEAAASTAPAVVTPLPHEETQDDQKPRSPRSSAEVPPPPSVEPASAAPPSPAQTAPASEVTQAAVTPPPSVPVTPAVLSATSVAAATSMEAAPSVPEAMLSATAFAFVPPQRRMGWFGVGVRFGTTQLRLAPPDSLVTRLNQSGTGQTWTASDLALNADARTVTPTLHFGGSGYFFKMDFPLSFAAEFTTVGLGLYPVNIGVFIDRLALMPYLSLGGTASVVRSNTTADPGTSNKIIGALVQARAAVGAKYFPVRGLALSVEAGYSRWAAGIMLMPPGAAPGTADDQTHMQGGVGSVVDLSFGAEWL
jgi:hypothetical protein